MAKIDIETLSLFRDPDDLIGFIALHRYEPENLKIHESDGFCELPQYLSDVIYILDFETLFDMEGLFSFLESVPGRYLSETIEAFEHTKNNEVADHLRQAQELLNKYGVTFDDLHTQAIERARLWKENEDTGNNDFEPELNCPELREEIAQIEETIYPIMDERDYWDNVKSIIREFADSRVRQRKDI